MRYEPTLQVRCILDECNYCKRIRPITHQIIRNEKPIVISCYDCRDKIQNTFYYENMKKKSKKRNTHESINKQS